MAAWSAQYGPMTLPARNLEPPPEGTSNVRLVIVDDDHRPRYLLRAAELENAVLALAERTGIGPQDMPGLHGMCVEAARAAERRGH